VAGGIWVLSSQSILPQLKGVLRFDKLQHALAWFVLAITFGLWASRASWQKRSRITALITAAAASVYGIIDEVHQYFVPGRSCNVSDWIADTLGAFLGAAAVWLAFRVARGRKHG
jgi:VanZ family protein